MKRPKLIIVFVSSVNLLACAGAPPVLQAVPCPKQTASPTALAAPEVTDFLSRYEILRSDLCASSSGAKLKPIP